MRGSQLLTAGEQAEAQVAEPQPCLPRLARIRAQVLDSEPGTVVSHPTRAPEGLARALGAT